MTLILHSFRRCPFAIRVRMTLEEKGLPYEVVEENLSEPSARLLELHQQGRVPLLIDGTQAIHESSVITEYLDEKYPSGTKLMPDTPEERARVRLWTVWCNELYKPDLDRFKYEHRDLTDRQRRDLIDSLNGHLSRIDAALADKRMFLVGDRLTLADIHVFPFYRQLHRVTQPEFPGLERFQNANAWLGRLIARPSFDRVMARPKGPGPKA